MQIAILTISDRASRGEYEDISGPTIASWLQDVVVSDYTLVREVAAGVRGRTLIVNRKNKELKPVAMNPIHCDRL